MGASPDLATGPFTEPRFAQTVDVPAELLQGLVLEHMHDAAFATDLHNNITFWSGSAARLFGVARDHAVGRPVAEVLPFEIASVGGEAGLLEEVAGGRSWRGQGSARLPDGRQLWIESTVNPIVRDGAVVGMVSVSRDMTRERGDARARVAAEEALRESEEQFREAFEYATIGMALIDLDGRWLRANSALVRLLGYTEEELQKRTFQDVTHQDDLEANLKLLADIVSGAISSYRMDKRYLRPNGSVVHATVTVSLARGVDGSPRYFVVQVVDRSAQVELAVEAQVRTSLAAGLSQIHAGATLEDSAQTLCDELCELPWIDFAAVEAFIEEGDAVVLGVRAPFGTEIRPGDRLPADEARYLYQRARQEAWAELTSPSKDVGTVAPSGLKAVAYQPIGNGQPVLAILIVGTREDDFAHMLVDRSPGMLAISTTASALLAGGLHERRAKAELRHQVESNLARGAFNPVFQPIVALGSGELVAYEALTRFESGRRADLCFAEAWDVGLGAELELATLRAALIQARSLPPIGWLDVNVSPRLLAQATDLRTLLETADRPLVLEITEHEQVADYGALRDSVRNLGPDVRLAVDDAGAGVANFAHIVELNPDFVKLDIGLVRGLDKDVGRQALVVAMRHFAQESGCRLVAEGVETPSEAETLIKLGVALAQGYLFARPMTIDAAVASAAEATARSGAEATPSGPARQAQADAPTPGSARQALPGAGGPGMDAGSAGTRPPLLPELRAWSEHSQTDRDRLFARYAAICAIATTILMAVGFLAGPVERPGLLLIDGLACSAVVLALALVRRGRSGVVLRIAGVVLMALGVVAGALLIDGLDGAAVMPLAGALMVIPVMRGRRLLAMFVLAFCLSFAGEAAAYTIGGMHQLASQFSVEVSLSESAVMLAFTYGLVWWVSKEWSMASERSARAAASERQLLTVNERLLATLDPGKVLNLIADSLKSVVDYDSLTIYRVDRSASLMRPVLARDRLAALILEACFPMDRGITGWVVSHGQPQLANDVQTDPRMFVVPGTPADPESLVVVPLLIDGVVGGTLNVTRIGRAESHFSPAEFELIQLFARQSSIALQNAEAHHAVWTRAQTDEVTGLRNRGAFEQEIAALVADPESRPLSLLMLDLDDFKGFNDRHGHPAGDALLRGVATAINVPIRDGDRVYRFGGDEFVIVLPGTAQGAAMNVAERIRAAVAGSDAVTGVAITASIGVASQVAQGPTRDGLVSAADAALYRAKASGGDRVAVAGLRTLPLPDVASPSRQTLQARRRAGARQPRF